MSNSHSSTAQFNKLTIKQLLEVAQSRQPNLLPVYLSSRVKRKKELIISTLLSSNENWSDVLYEKLAEADNIRHVSQRSTQTQQIERQRLARQEARSSPSSGEFLDLPSCNERMKCFQDFYDATSNTAIQKLVCAVCAWWLNNREYAFSKIYLNKLPGAERLYPAVRHPKQELIGPLGCLLERKGCTWDWEEMDWLVNVCCQCYQALSEPLQLPPKYSLANDLWIGPVPWILQQLTIVERLLISHVFPRVFVVKLFPAGSDGTAFPEDQLQRSMRGNVTSFELNGHDIAHMIDGHLMPRPTSILASVLSVTFIGKKSVKDPAALNLFRVRRELVRSALTWLQENNPRYYSKIEIDNERMTKLPIDDVPFEVMVNIHHEEDISIINAETGGYAPTSGEDDLSNTMDFPEHTETSGALPLDPDVVPLQYLGVHDNDLTKVPVDELMSWGLQNLLDTTEDPECAYAVRYGRAVNTFGQPRMGEPPTPIDALNYWEQAFPTLYPFGLGGIERTRPVKLSFMEQVRWSLAYHDLRFHHHNCFIFVAFGIHQKRKALGSVRLLMKRHDFDATARTLDTITPIDLEKATEEERQKKPISNPAVRLLKQKINDVSRRVVGSNASRVKLRSRIWSTMLFLNPPTLWITINPDDLHDPIPQVLVGEEIDLNNFVTTAGPNAVQRARNIARDPFAAAEFFHYLIKTILETLFGVTTTASRIQSRMGVLGHVSGYFGTVECQGRGTLHLHMLVWLHKAPPPRKLGALLQSENFKKKIIEYLRLNVRSYLPQLATPAHLQIVQSNSGIAYSRPLNPASMPDTFWTEATNLETNVVRTKQMHTCVYRKCLRFDQYAKLVCKRRAPWELSENDAIESDGNYRTKRSLAYMNAYCPAIAITARCNQDIKFLTHGRDVLNILFYTTKYIAKEEHCSHNVSGLLAQGLYYHFLESPEVTNLQTRQGDLINRSLNILNREQEIPGPLVVSYLMGWGDTYCSHQYVPIFWTSFVHLINQQFPSLDIRPERMETNFSNTAHVVEPEVNENNEPSTNDNELTTLGDDRPIDNEEESVLLIFNNRGQLRPRSQIDDYIYRGEGASQYNVLDYFTGTYESRKLRKGTNSANINEDPLMESGPLPSFTQLSQGRRVGRPTHKRIEYLEQHPRHETHTRIVRPSEHIVLPNLIGPHFPRRTDPEKTDLHAAWCLTLLKPWRALDDLKQLDQSWTSALEEFLRSADDRILDIVDNLDHYRSCESSAEIKRSSLNVLEDDGLDDQTNELAEDINSSRSNVISSLDITQEMVDQAKKETESGRDAVHGYQAVSIGRSKGLFDVSGASTVIATNRATNIEVEKLNKWLGLLEQERTLANEIAQPTENTGAIGAFPPPSVIPINELYDTPYTGGNIVDPLQEQSITPVAVECLFPEQRRGFDIVQWHLDRIILSQNHASEPPPPQLLMLLIGEGGTGKSKVIQTITQQFERRRCKHMLLKAAYTGIAASLIDGKTTHRIGQITVGRKKQVLSDDARAKLAIMWKYVRYLIIDEYSMLSKEFLACLSRHISIAKMEYDSSVGSLPFGGVNVILGGDLHQFPPVAAPSRGALYHPTNLNQGDIDQDAGAGRAIYERFTTVIKLTKQVRVVDQIWRDFLDRLRRGMVNEKDITMLKSIVLTHPTCVPTEFGSEEWKDAVLITPRHAVRTRWNKAAVKRHCQQTGHQLYICPAYDTIKGKNGRRPLYLHEQLAATISKISKKDGGGRKGRNGLSDEVFLAIGLKIMVTLNVQTDLDVANGARGVIVGIGLDPGEPDFDPNAPIVNLSRLPSYILVRLDRTRASALPGLPQGTLPIVPTMRTYSIQVLSTAQNMSVEVRKRTIERLQYPITPAYAFTDYRSQGQTIPAVIVDIATPPTGSGLSLANIYVALSRSSGRKTIRILREFDESIFAKPVDYDLVKEDERQEKLNEQTKAWWGKLRN
ncbi:hypothetical protein RSOLAG1IB_11903 [Rhizoctonia solani AG-1 IB]|uniref:ATP-dependent DNA helicase n=1 Tax=Thanatephorus cucumeris (strain AG1-IB / isolate 7/3/14) TaxID=1108050 RepID=A0A0B7FJI3_THACB|nr:hypothetical protein RSOLAG1IB_11903 [Rhizoctonia solani AG-1 IB]